MTRKSFQATCLISIGLLLGVILTIGDVTAQRISPPDTQDHIKLKFNLAPGESRSFPLPENDCPVRIEVSTSTINVVAANGSTFSRPLVLMTTIALDSESGRIAGLGVNDHNNEGICPSGPDFGCANVAIEITSKGVITVRQSTTGGAQISNPQTMICVGIWF